MRPLLAPGDSSVAAGPRPSFSIVIAAYQVADVIHESIESAMAQTLPPIDIVVCDDGSTDGLDAALARHRDSLAVVRNATNRGEAAAKNAAARHASGDFVAILDADDVYFPDRLEALGELAAVRPDLDILTTDAYLELNGTRIRRCYEAGWTFEVHDQRRGILERNFIFGLAAVRRERMLAAGGFDETLRWATDWDLWIRLILDGSRAGAVAEPLALYRLRPSSLSAQRAKLAAGRLRALEKATANPSLSTLERGTLDASIALERRRLAMIELRQALAEGGPQRRRRALTVARGPHPAGTRLKAAAAAVAPGIARRVLRAREGDVWIAAGGTSVRPSAASEPGAHGTPGA